MLFRSSSPLYRTYHTPTGGGFPALRYFLHQDGRLSHGSRGKGGSRLVQAKGIDTRSTYPCLIAIRARPPFPLSTIASRRCGRYFKVSPPCSAIDPRPDCRSDPSPSLGNEPGPIQDLTLLRCISPIPSGFTTPGPIVPTGEGPFSLHRFKSIKTGEGGNQVMFSISGSTLTELFLLPFRRIGLLGDGRDILPPPTSRRARTGERRSWGCERISSWRGCSRRSSRKRGC